MLFRSITRRRPFCRNRSFLVRHGKLSGVYPGFIVSSFFLHLFSSCVIELLREVPFMSRSSSTSRYISKGLPRRKHAHTCRHTCRKLLRTFTYSSNFRGLRTNVFESRPSAVEISCTNFGNDTAVRVCQVSGFYHLQASKEDRKQKGAASEVARMQRLAQLRAGNFYESSLGLPPLADEEEQSSLFSTLQLVSPDSGISGADGE